MERHCGDSRAADESKLSHDIRVTMIRRECARLESREPTAGATKSWSDSEQTTSRVSGIHYVVVV